MILLSNAAEGRYILYKCINYVARIIHKATPQAGDAEPTSTNLSTHDRGVPWKLDVDSKGHLKLPPEKLYILPELKDIAWSLLTLAYHKCNHLPISKLVSSDFIKDT